MRLLRSSLVPVFVLCVCSSLSAGQRPLAIDDIESWKRITETVLSPDGQWIAYKTEPARGDSKLYLYSRGGEKRFEFDGGSDLRFTDDSQFLVFSVSPGRAAGKPTQREGRGRALAIYRIASGRLEQIKSVRNYKIPTRSAPWLAYQVETPSEETATNAPARRESPRRGSSLHLRNLESGKARSWPLVTEYSFAAKDQRLVFVSTGDGKQLNAGVYLYDFRTSRLTPIAKGRADYRQIAVSDDAEQVAFLRRPREQSKSEDFGLYMWTAGDKAKEVAHNHTRGVPVKWRISEHGRLFFSGDGRRLFFGTAPVRPSRNPSIRAEDYPEVDIWHGGEGVLHTEQLATKNRDLRRTHLAMVDLPSGEVSQIETPDMPQSRLLDGGDADCVLLHSTKPYELESMWDPMRYDAYLLDLNAEQDQRGQAHLSAAARSGSTTQVGPKTEPVPRGATACRLIVRGARDRLAPSPGATYLIWFDYADYSYYTYHVASGKKHRITTRKVIRADEEANTTFDYNAPYGVAGWLAGDRAVLIYDRYDVWKVDPENGRPPENLTRTGRRDKTVYRLLRFAPGDTFDETKTQYLLGVNQLTRASGYYRCRLDKPAEPELLLGGKYRLSNPLKAARADTVVYTKETFNVFPDLLVSDLTFRDSRRISDANPQQADVLWGTAELFRWTSLDGRPLEGILHKPENFDPSRRYPMIVQFFHKSSDQLFTYRPPEFHRSRIDYHYFVSNGYIVFTPDIYFDPGYIGESAYKSIMPGMTALIDAGTVDPRRIGLQGHSYSGYQAAYMATRTNLFAAIEAGAPVVNFFSAYGGIRWESGGSRAAQYEHDQTLGSPWEVPARFYENSPIFALDKVRTPILVLHNDQDGAVPWTQGIELFIGLRRLQKPVWLLNYNGEGHGIVQFKNRKDFQIRLSQFFGHYLKGEPMAEWMRTGVPAVDKEHNLGYGLEP